MQHRPFRFGIQTGPLDDREALRSYVRQVESLGYDEFYSADHIGTAALHENNRAVDPFVALVTAADATTTLRVGPLVLNNEFHQPALLARTAISVDQMTSGRLVLGLGTGYAQSEHEAIGLRLLPPGERVTRFSESLEILRQLLNTSSCSFEGKYHKVEIEHLGIGPVQQQIPLLIGGHGKRVVSLAASYADIFQYTGLVHGPDGSPTAAGFPLDEVRKRSLWLADAAGDRSDAIERSSLVQVTHVGKDAPTVEALAERFRLDPEQVVDTPFALTGSLEQIVDKIERLRAQLGISHYVVRDAEGFAPVVAALTGK